MSLQAKLADFERELRAAIPLIEHMGFESLQYDEASLSVRAALAPNKNDKGTAFAGALSASANVTGWGLITLLLSDEPRPYDVVIRDSRLEYFLPVTRDFTVTARLPASGEVERFLEKLRARGKARLDLVVEVCEDEQCCFRLQGAYVALEKRQWV
ncbi:YiiD C-terminal domain-containing protein [Motiliproteus sp. SC1-56]|uniref:YiiD C-terminal domain-containing protein n=1 Tax=Motiliproteus sp. SC1-56 TaxID=2799565 RepID=UPI001A8EF226|nr:YiiD C-terminal domain-containing protein [Motiliproteus sp. SC1-56]